MTTIVEMSYQQAKQYLQNLALPADAKITLEFESDKQSFNQRQQHGSLNMIRQLRGSTDVGMAEALLQERQQDKHLETDV